MQLRRELGNRQPSIPSRKATISGPVYLFPYACFACRKSFKRKHEEGMPNKLCPHCGGTAVGLSRNFRAPPMGDVQQWKTVAYLVQHGFRYYHQYNHDGLAVPHPTTLREAKEFVALYEALKTPQ